MIEIISRRQENTKTFWIDSKKRRLVASIGAVHYKDNYADASEQWKDIDLTWVGNQILKAPYELTLEGKKVTIRDKKTGEVSIIELTEIGGKSIHSPSDQAWEKSKGLAKAPGIIALDNIALNTDLEIVAENGRVKFTRVLKSDKAPLDAKFRTIGNWVVKAKDTDGELPVETSLVDGILTETLKPDRTIRYPVRIDPTLPVQVAASTDDCYYEPPVDYFDRTDVTFLVGYYDATETSFGSAARFLNVTIPVGSTITLANLILTCRTADNTTVVKSRLRAEANVSPATFSTKANFLARTWTTAYANWDAIPAWASDVEYTSSDLHLSIQEVINLLGWVSGNAMTILWDDWENRSTQAAARWRRAYSYDDSTTKAPKLYVEYTDPPSAAYWNGLIAEARIYKSRAFTAIEFLNDFIQARRRLP